MTIEEFNIKLSLDTKEAQSKLDKFSKLKTINVNANFDTEAINKKMDHLSSVINKLASTMDTFNQFATGIAEGIADGLGIDLSECVEEVEDATDELKDYKEELDEVADKQKEVGKETEKTTEKTKKAEKQQNSFWKKIKEMALGSFVFNKISQAIQKIADAYKEGIQNVYLFSKANNGVFASIMDSWSSKITALKNAIGAVVATFITAIEPYIEKIVTYLIELFNQISLFLSRLFKIDAVLANADIIKQWANNNKETQKTLQLLSGFDTLTIFDNSDTSKSTDTAVEDMFTVKEYDGVDPWKSLKEWWNGYTIYTTDEETGQQRILDQQEGVIDKLKGLLVKAKEWFVGEDPESGKTGVWQRYVLPKIEEWWEDIKKWFDKIWNDTIVPELTKLFNKVVAAITNNAEDAVDTVVSKIPVVGEGMVSTKNFNKIGTAITGENPIISSAKDIWKFIKDSFSTGWKNYFGGSFAASANATGGVYTRPTLGLVAEYSGAQSNPELITPTSLLDERLQANNNSLLNGYNVIAQQIIAAIKNVDMKVSIGDDVIASSCSRGNSNYNKMTGRTLF